MGHILACHKEMSFVSSRCTFSDRKNTSTSSITGKCLEKNTIKQIVQMIALSSFWH